MNLRALAANVLFDVTQKHRSLADALPPALAKCTDVRDSALLQAFCFGVCRHYFRLDALAKQLMPKPLKAKDQDIYMLILLGLYQLAEMRLPDYAAVSETVSAATKFKKLWAKNLINGVLRNYQRQSQALLAAIVDDQVATYSHPEWMIKKLQQAYPEDWQAILNANNQHPPLALRVNQQKISRDAYLKKLNQAEITATVIAETADGIYLEKPMDVNDIPGFFAGEVSVQDGAAQLSAELLQLQPAMRVLDACAAPGGKTSHILETMPTVDLLAVDREQARVAAIQENLQRLNLSAKCLCADAGDPSAWWDQKLFDRILLDAPCSASGVIRRHPDIKLLRLASDLPQFSREQMRLLNALWPLLKQGGLLVYVTCSVFSEENIENIQRFLAAHPDAIEEKIAASWGSSCPVGRQILPAMHGMDGFYYACLRKCG